MSGFYSKKLYDTCDQKTIVNIETGPGTYKTLPMQIEIPMCDIYNTAPNNSNFWQSNTINNINYISDIESHLKNLDIPDSRCLERRTLIEKDHYAKELINKISPLNTTCSRNLEPNYSRLEYTTSTFKEKPQTRIEFPIIDPREFVYNGINSEQSGNNRFGVNTRLQAKDLTGVKFYNKIQNDISNIV